MLDQVLNIFEIQPDIDLDVMKNAQDLTDITSSVLICLQSVLSKEKPDVVIVHGDTTTAFAATLASFYNKIPVLHVEAGLRTNDINSPFPEEANRQIISRLAKFHFAPTSLSKINLVNENVDESRIAVTGNTVVDALQIALCRLSQNHEVLNTLSDSLNELLNFPWMDSKYILITGHRRENFGDGFQQICQAIKDLSSIYPETHFVYPVHLNPNVQKPVFEMLQGLSNVHLIMPLDYLQFVLLMKHCYLVLTDSGGIQEEAPSLGKPVLVMRENTERPEGVEAGTVVLIGANSTNIVAGTRRLLDSVEYYDSVSKSLNPYGDGHAARYITEVIENMKFENL